MVPFEIPMEISMAVRSGIFAEGRFMGKVLEGRARP